MFVWFGAEPGEGNGSLAQTKFEITCAGHRPRSVGLFRSLSLSRSLADPVRGRPFKFVTFAITVFVFTHSGHSKISLLSPVYISNDRIMDEVMLVMVAWRWWMSHIVRPQQITDGSTLLSHYGYIFIQPLTSKLIPTRRRRTVQCATVYPVPVQIRSPEHKDLQ